MALLDLLRCVTALTLSVKHAKWIIFEVLGDISDTLLSEICLLLLLEWGTLGWEMLEAALGKVLEIILGHDRNVIALAQVVG